MHGMVFVSKAPSDKFHFYFFLLFLSQNARCQKSLIIHCFVIHLKKIERACLFERPSFRGIFVEVGLPYFQGLHFHSNIALSKNLKLYSLSLVILISSHLSSSQSSAYRFDGFPDQSRNLFFFFYHPVELRCVLEL